MSYKIMHGDVTEQLATIGDKSVQCCVTSPPYWGLRDYGHTSQLGLERTPNEYVDNMVEVFKQVYRVLADDGVLWLNLGDSYASFRDGKATPDTTRGNSSGTLVPKGSAANRMASSFHGSAIKHKELVGIPWRVAFALQSYGWYLRQDIIWHKPNPMPESVTDRCTKAHEYLFMLTKRPNYYYDHNAIKEPALWVDDKRANQGRFTYEGKRKTNDGLVQQSFVTISDKKNKRSVWSIPTRPFKGAHFAVMPELLVEPCILASTRINDVVLDPFTGSGTVAVVALRNNRQFVGTELNADYIKIANERIRTSVPNTLEGIG